MLENYTKHLYKIIIILMLSSSLLAIYSFLQPTTISTQVNKNTSQIETGYDYKAEITPNVLYPSGGTVDAGNTLFNTITTAIPVNLHSTIFSEREVTARGTHEVQLVIKAGEIWERSFPLGKKHSFEHSGTEISILDDTYKIDLEQVKSFIMQVEKETGITPTQYTLEVLPNIEGFIKDAGREKAFQVQDRLVFQYTFNEILLASEKNFTSMIDFSSSNVDVNSFSIFGFGLSLYYVRIGSTAFSFLLLLAFLFLHRNSNVFSTTKNASEMEIINKRYANRIIPVTQKINISQKSIFVLDSFKSILKIADEKELSIFLNKDQKEASAVYFIVDGDYLYTYETIKMNHIPNDTNLGSDAYARG
jgi:Family of unknown function (DUF5305)